MSYTNDVKLEILNNGDITILEKLVEMSTILKIKDSFYDDKIEFKIENIAVAKRIYKFIKELTELKIEIKYSVSKKLGEHKVYIIKIPRQKGYAEFKNNLKELDYNEIIKNDEYLKGFIRGIFLMTAYIKDPKKEYALDFFMESEKISNLLFDILLYRNKKAFKTIKRKKPLIYLRNSEDIMDILVLVGALNNFFKYEEMTMIKDLKNKTIREMNWEVANETKTLNTGNRHINMIETIDEKLGLKSLTPVLQEVALVRLENPESSLKEIAEIIGISKSGVKNRFRRLEDIYNEITE